MAQIIKIKRSTSVSTPGSALNAGELAYSFGSGGSSGSDKLFIGDGSNNFIIGGKTYVDMLDHTAGTLTADSAIVVDSNSKINQLKTANLTLGASSLASSGALTLSGAAINVNGTGTLTITHGGTIDLDAQANAVKVLDNSSTALVIQEGSTAFLTIDTTNSAEKVLVSKTLDINGNELILDVDGDSSITADTDDEIHVKVGGSDRAKITSAAIIPATDGGIALGTSSLKFGAAYVDNIKIDGNAITSENTNGDISITPNGTGQIVLDGFTFPQNGAGSAGQFLRKASDGSLEFGTVTSSFTLAADSGSNDTFSTGGTLTLAGGAGITSTVSNDQVSFAVNVDDSTVEISSDALRVKDSGIATAKIANSAVTNAKLANSSVTVGTTAISLGSSATTISGVAQLNVDNLRLDGNTISSTNSNGNIVLDPNGTGIISASSARITSVAEPVNSSDAATKSYVDAVKQALDIKESVRVATTANITIATALNVGDTIDGVTLADGDRVLVKNQTTGSQNGIYVAGASPARAADANSNADVTSGLFVFVEEGTANGDNGYVLTTNDDITLDSTALTFTQFSGAGAVEAGNGLSRSGTTLSVNVGNTLQIASDTVNIKGVTTTATGDIILGSGGANGGYSRLAVGSTDQMLKVSGGTLVYTDTIDGGTFT